MKSVLVIMLSLLALTFPSALATTVGLRSVWQPLYLPDSDDESPNLVITKVPFVSYYSSPEWMFSAICKPFIPPTDVPEKSYGDINIASIYGIKASGTYIPNSGYDVRVIIDASKAKKPKGYYPYTITEVVDSVVACVKLMYPAGTKSNGALTITIIPSTKEPSK